MLLARGLLTEVERKRPEVTWRFTVTCSTLKTAKEPTEFALVPNSEARELFVGPQRLVTDRADKNFLEMTARIFQMNMCCCCCCKCSDGCAVWGDWQQRTTEGLSDEHYQGASS